MAIFLFGQSFYISLPKRSKASQKTTAVRWLCAWSDFFDRDFLWYFLFAAEKKVHSRWSDHADKRGYS